MGRNSRLLLKTVVDTRGIGVHTFTNVRRGRWTAELPELEGLSKNGGVVAFMLASRFNQCVKQASVMIRQERTLTSSSPLAMLAPTYDDLGKTFGNMWNEAEANSKKWGCKLTMSLSWIIDLTEEL
jgi:hypothetical protein